MPAIRRNPLYVNSLPEMMNQLVEDLFKVELTRLARDLDEIVLENQKLGGTMNAFVYQGDIHSTLTPIQLRGIGPIAPLRGALEPQADIYLARLEKAKRDRQRVINSLAVVTRFCRSRQDVRDVFPETLVALVPSLREMERQRDEGFMLRNKPVLLKQFQETVDLLLDYQANRLIYT